MTFGTQAELVCVHQQNYQELTESQPRGIEESFPKHPGDPLALPTLALSPQLPSAVPTQGSHGGGSKGVRADPANATQTPPPHSSLEPPQPLAAVLGKAVGFVFKSNKQYHTNAI